MKTAIENSINKANRSKEGRARTIYLARLAWKSDDADFMSFITAVFKAVFSNEDPYSTVHSSAWAFRAMVERGHTNNLSKLLTDVLNISDNIANPVSRADALFLVWQALFPLGDKVHRKVLERFILACNEMNSWKGPVLLVRAVAILASEDINEARKIVDGMREGRHKRQAANLLINGTFSGPRRFFWK